MSAFCGRLWTTSGEHYCNQPPGHKPPCQCYCGQKAAP